MYGPIYNSQTKVCKRRTIKQLKQSHGKGSIVKFMKVARMEWADHVPTTGETTSDSIDKAH